MGLKSRGKWFSGYRSALQHRDLRLLLGALLVSATGSWAYNVALLAFVYDRTHSLGWVAAAGLCRFVSALAASPYGGVIAERTERIRLMFSADLLCALWQFALALVILSAAPVVLALVFAALNQITNVVYNPAVAATIPSIVSEDDLVAANAINGTIDNLVVVVGPALGALVLLVASPGVAVTVNGASFLISALIVSRIRVRSHPVDVTEGGTAGPLRQMAVGIRTILGLSSARTLVAFCALASFVYGTDTVLFVGASQSRLGTGPEGFGYLLAGLGLGGVIVAPFVDRLSRLPRLGPVILAGMVLYALPTAVLAVTHSPDLAFVVQILRGAATLLVDVMAITSLQRSVPADQLARVFGVFWGFMLAAIALGTLITPLLVRAFDLEAALWIMALAPAALALCGFASLRRVDRESRGRALALAPKVAILEGLGIFSGATRATLERLAGAAEEVGFLPSASIIREGEDSDALYVLTEGRVEVSAHGEAGGPERVIRTMAAPAYFGEIGVLEHIPRTASVTALSACRCDRIDGQAFLDSLLSAPPSSSLMENSQSRLAVTHPSRRVTFDPPESARRSG
jgi:CRP-like cAMP-binding protein/predicted MFS family arabinose efflux permease